MENQSNERPRTEPNPNDNAEHTIKAIKASEQAERKRMEDEAANTRAARRSAAREIISSSGIAELENTLTDDGLEKLDKHHGLLQRDWRLSNTGKNKFRAMVNLSTMDCRRRTI